MTKDNDYGPRIFIVTLAVVLTRPDQYAFSRLPDLLRRNAAH